MCLSIEWARDHYSVLGLSRNASLADIKREYRLLARKYHPDVSKDLKAGEIFKSIRVAYEALSNDRAQYDRELKFQETMDGPYGRNWTYVPEQEYRRRIYRWTELRYRMQNKRRKARPYYDQSDSYEEASDYQRGPFSEVLLSASLTLFFTQIVGPRLALAMKCSCFVSGRSRWCFAYIMHLFRQLGTWKEQQRTCCSSCPGYVGWGKRFKVCTPSPRCHSCHVVHVYETLSSAQVKKFFYDGMVLTKGGEDPKRCEYGIIHHSGFLKTEKAVLLCFIQTLSDMLV